MVVLAQAGMFPGMSLMGLLKASRELRDLLNASLNPAPVLRVPLPQAPRLCSPDRANAVGTANDYARRWRRLGQPCLPGHTRLEITRLMHTQPSDQPAVFPSA